MVDDDADEDGEEEDMRKEREVMEERPEDLQSSVLRMRAPDSKPPPPVRKPTVFMLRHGSSGKHLQGAEGSRDSRGRVPLVAHLCDAAGAALCSQQVRLRGRGRPACLCMCTRCCAMSRSHVCAEVRRA